MTKEAHARLDLCQEHIQAQRLADMPGTATMPLETYPGRRIVRQQDVHTA